MSELRYHPFRDNWVILASHRQERTFFPPDDYCPLCPTAPGGFPTEIPFADYEIAAFENKFPSLVQPAPSVASKPSGVLQARPANGVCEVVCYSADHTASLATLSLVQIERLILVWQDRFRDLSTREGIEYVLIFENKGKEIGVTLPHPHCQIYAYSYLPESIRLEIECERQEFEKLRETITDQWLSEELDDGSRVIAEGEHLVTLCPYFSRFPFEAHIVAKWGLRNLDAVTEAAAKELAASLKRLTQSYDQLFGFSLPYVMAIKQAPLSGDYDFMRLRIEFTPIHRTESKLKYLAGSELAAGAFILDVSPEEAAEKLRRLTSEL